VPWGRVVMQHIGWQPCRTMAEGVGVYYGEGKGCTTALPKLMLPCCSRAKGTTPLYCCWGVGVRSVYVCSC
jgi:hypothetical protein